MTVKKTEELDFSPFNAEDVLTALCKVLRTSKAISFSYAGDIQSLIDRIGRVFHAARCLMFVAAKDGRVEIFEYVAESVEPVAFSFAGPHGQALAIELMNMQGDINVLDDGEKYGGQLKGTYAMPLKIRGDGGGESGGVTKERRAGLLCLQEGPLSRWNKLVLDIFVVMADHLARLAQIEQLSSALADLDGDDKVTTFLKGRFAAEAVQQELTRVEFHGDAATLIIVDLDLGSKSPAVYGTSLGEAVIKTVASTIATHSRTVDIRGRLGLDEYLLFCPRMDDAEALKLAEHLVKRINENLMNLTHQSDKKAEPGIFVPTTVSVGVSHWQQGKTYDMLFASAQEALNTARQAGGNQAKSL